ncbi:MAG: YrbL family protein [Psychroserpens sp.]|uniref:YrbL family protein n=1 Tax=Psychroserpens sp. TaxID=2020870 RepID=UPI003CBE5939
MIILNKDDFFANGFCQKCYQHPENPNLCVKVVKNEATAPTVNRHDNEIKYYKKLNKRNSKRYKYQFYSKLIATKSTNLGVGQVFEIVRDDITNDISKTLEYYLLNLTESITLDKLKSSFKILVDLMVKHRIIVTDLRPQNICCKIKQDGEIEMVLIDGLGHRDFIPLVDWFSFFSKKKIYRRLDKYKMRDLEEQRRFLKEKQSK